MLSPAHHGRRQADPSMEGPWKHRQTDLLKKCPWKEEMRSPREQRTRITASHAVARVRLCVSSARSLAPSRAALKPRRAYVQGTEVRAHGLVSLA